MTSSRPSLFYRASVWKFALGIARWMPKRVLDGICVAVAELYNASQHRRREIVVNNLEPVLGSRALAENMTHKLFRQFGLKLADLWRFEANTPLPPWELKREQWDKFLAARERGRGVLLVTPHLGNWELGAPLLASYGCKVLVLTQAEPGSQFTDLRKASRAKQGIETIVVREDMFAFVEIIKRLQSGAVIALLIDRPPAQTAASIEFFGRPFQTSIAAAELARATGCALFGVTVVRRGTGYLADMLPEFEYDRAALDTRAARQDFSGRIMRAFEPVIRENIDQWFHFVPIWPEQTAPHERP